MLPVQDTKCRVILRAHMKLRMIIKNGYKKARVYIPGLYIN
ncbi:hypothetical protein SAMN05421797_1011695 [Maribacter ulvicola]|uniref:Uncharacterized protein n=1 Tax=Maribacter ulvicola TaxID=228959 RepID=A0A1N6SJS0_9FLAO|nr:hypothetical protein SAMN05421797_1011695 [Maribacter ulvicola]